MLKAFALTLLCLTAHASIEEENNVLVLTKHNFEEAVQTHETVLVEFYAPWCGHCKSLAPEYEKAAEVLKDEGSPIKLAKVDATVETELAEEHEVKGYPTLFLFRNGEPSPYKGGRDHTSIVAWLKKKTGFPATILKTDDELKAFRSSDDVVVPLQNSEDDAAKTYVNFASSFDDMQFGMVENADIASSLGLADGDIIILYTTDNERVAFEGSLTEENLKEFVQVNRLPLVPEFDDKIAPVLFGGKIKSHHFLFVSKNAENFDHLIKEFRAAAEQFRGQMVFILVNTDIEDNERILQFFGVNNNELPSSRIIFIGEESLHKYKSDSNEVTTDEIVKFTNAYFNGELKRHLNSEEVPDDWDKEPVKVLVGKNFKEVALDKSKTVIVMFYAPWCGHCKALAPVWEELGEVYKNSKNIVIAKMDATANEIEEVTVHGFPTIKLFPAGSDEIKDAGGARTVKDLSALLAEYEKEQENEEEQRDKDEL
ncbi:hypothetical protein QR680_007202 [Steinernema hermaphroditum]|uniref:Protein disulfide-isomerase n=1 Tax=Steinernema hermaphroditum TaxID=289476 RepID=A0AA39HZK7_9BILA|nr:hypothetical protein QR680_007202 [Steinernema hermaphroditum]